MDVCLVVNTLTNLIELGSVSIAKKGIIEYVRGAVKAVNRRKLEESVEPNPRGEKDFRLV
jgi:hypothetical protein